LAVTNDAQIRSRARRWWPVPLIHGIKEGQRRTGCCRGWPGFSDGTCNYVLSRMAGREVDGRRCSRCSQARSCESRSERRLSNGGRRGRENSFRTCWRHSLSNASCVAALCRRSMIRPIVPETSNTRARIPLHDPEVAASEPPARRPSHASSLYGRRRSDSGFGRKIRRKQLVTVGGRFLGEEQLQRTRAGGSATAVGHRLLFFAGFVDLLSLDASPGRE